MASFPINTHGGQLSAGRLHGYGFLHEAVVQLRGDGGPRQIAKAEPAGRHCSRRVAETPAGVCSSQENRGYVRIKTYGEPPGKAVGLRPPITRQTTQDQ